ncbi:MAG: hypothetical protein II621_00825 [Clostridia bacterium]|jgi:hypothetical protein|nr:hypothetical protein [Clostridia bacterium]MBQ4365163.1 hypothetical protein [Clostridia bacterium]MBR3095117.1 hypothetical protein [Clostridia bacterium]
MKKIICKREYDTEVSTLIEKRTSGAFGDPAGYEETLYQTPKGYYFLYVNGGEDSPYQKEDIKSVSAAKAEAWLNNK